MLSLQTFSKTGKVASNQEVANAECANIAKCAALLCDFVDMDDVILKGKSDAGREYYYMYPDTLMAVYEKLKALVDAPPAKGRK